jgi:hypothetical protein
MLADVCIKVSLYSSFLSGIIGPNLNLLSGMLLFVGE